MGRHDARKPRKAARKLRFDSTAEKRSLPRWWRPYLAALAKTGNRTQAAAAARIDRSTPWAWFNLHPELPELKREWDEAVAAAIDSSMDLLEQEARRRAEEGVLEPVFQGGKEVGTIRRYSDTLLIFLLNGGRPEKYRQRHELTGKDGAPLAPPVLTVVVKRAGDS